MTGASDDGQAGVTEADRATAESLTLHTGAEPYELAIEWIAGALAAERAKAREPFLAVADELHARGTAEVAAMDDEPDEHRKNQCASRAATYARAEHLIRRAAEEQQ